MVERNIALYGTDEKLPDLLELKAGPVSATFDAGQLRWIKVGGVEVVRAIAFLIRDRNWSTATPEIVNLRLDQSADRFTLDFDARCPTVDGDFTWHGRFEGKADGTLICFGKGRPAQDFKTCRTGFVILHPLQGTVGRAMTVEHTDGTAEAAVVPEAIVPDQPYLLVRAMTHEPIPGLKATIRMEGDSWETEDHRNWTDASLKTYSRPLSLPWPYTIAKGEEVAQSVTLSFSGKLPAAPARVGPVRVRVGGEAGKMPEVGLSVLPEDAQAAAEVAPLVKEMALSHLNCRVDLRSPDWKSALPHYRKLLDAADAKLALEIILVGDKAPAAEIDAVAAAVREAGLDPSAVIATPAADLTSYPPGTPSPDGVPTYDAVASALRSAFPRSRIGGGMLSNFTELNRKPTPKNLFDYITHATSGLVHAADDQSVMETLEAIGHIIRSTKKIAGDAPVRVGPSHIGNSFNPYGSRVTPNPDNGRVTMARVEPRHRGLFGAAWHLGVLAQAAEGGVEAVTVASPVGEFGVAYRKLPHTQPWFDGAADAKVYPLFHVIAGIAAASGKPRMNAWSSDSGRVCALAWSDGKALHVWLANVTAETVDAEIEGATVSKLAMLDAENFEAAVAGAKFMNEGRAVGSGAFRLSPYAVARVTLEG